MKFKIVYYNQPRKFLKNEEKNVSKRIIDKIENTLTENPVPHNAKRIIGKKELVFRIRVGDCRVLYEMDYNLGEIGIIKIDKRSKVYDE